MQILQIHFEDYIPKYQIFVEQEEDVDKLVQHWQQPTTPWHGEPVIGFMAETYLDDLPTNGFKHFNPLWSFPATSVNQNWEAMTLGMAPWHLVDETDRHKEALVSQSPIAVFKSCLLLQALGIVYSKIALSSSDSKGESKGRTYCPATWSKSYQWQYAADYADQLRQVGASALLCHGCTLLVIAQLSKNKNANHPNCAFADSASTVMSGVMISLTPCIKAEVERQVALDEHAEFQDADDMIQKLNLTLSKPHGFPPIPAQRKDCHTLTFEAKKRHHQYVVCPEQDCESLVYFSDQNHSIFETLGLHQHPFWADRVKAFYKWYNKSASKTSKDAWTWEEGKDTTKWSLPLEALPRETSQFQ